MKSNYQKTKGGKDGNFFKRHLYAILLGFSVITIAAIITITLLMSQFGGAPPAEIPGPPGGGDDYEVTAPAPQFVMPVATVNLGQTAALDRLIWCRTLRQWRTHDGVDFLGTQGTEVMAILDGTVTNIQNTVMEGTVVTITHGGGLVSEYMALSSQVAVEIGDAVKAGDRIGVMAGSSLVNSAVGAHLHLRMRQNGNLVDPMDFLPGVDK